MENMKWWQKTLVYQIYPKSFADTTGNGMGDIQGIIRKLDYLKDLGVGAVWLTPVYRSPMVDNGYDIADYCSIDPSYGTMADMEELIAEGKKRGIQIVMDLVFNHSSDQHAWFQAARKNRTNPWRDWYIWRNPKPDGSAPTNWRSIFGGSAWTLDEETGQYYLHTFAREQPDLNWENPAVRQALYLAARFWLDKGVGGFRIDAITYIKKPKQFKDYPADGPDGLAGIHAITANSPGILEFLQEFRQAVFAGQDIFTVAEANGVAPEELDNWVGEQGVFDMLFEFSHSLLGSGPEELWCRPAQWKLTALKKALFDSQQATERNGWYPIFFENHDQRRSVDHFFPEPVQDKKAAAKVLAVILLTLRGTPFIYQGEELGYENMALPSIEAYDDISSKGQYALALKAGYSPAEALRCIQYFSRDNARTPMQWNAGENAGFTAGAPWLPVHPDYKKCNAADQLLEPGSVLNWYRQLSQLRQRELILRAGSFAALLPADESLLGYDRILGKKRIRVLANFTEQTVVIPDKLRQGAVFLLGSYGDTLGNALRPLEACLYRIDEGAEQ